jgi:hypothetical protein
MRTKSLLGLCIQLWPRATNLDGSLKPVQGQQGHLMTKRYTSRQYHTRGGLSYFSKMVQMMLGEAAPRWRI